MTEHVGTEADAARLAARILGPRERPLIVLSTDPRTGELAIDLDEVRRGVGSAADIVVISTGPFTFALSDRLPERAQVYGGAGRSYPVDFGRDPDWRRSPLRFPGDSSTRSLVGDALAQANAAGLFATPAPSRVRAEGDVVGFVPDGSRAVVEVDGHGRATISREATYPPFPLEWTLARGQRVSGMLDLESRRMFVEAPPPARPALAAHFPDGAVTLAFVARVGETASLLLHPALEPVKVRRRDVSSNPLDSIPLLLTEGDVVAARIVHQRDGSLGLRLVDVDDDEAIVPPLPVTPGGPPWLAEARALIVEPHTDTGPIAMPLPGAGDEASAVAPGWTSEPSPPIETAIAAPVEPEALAERPTEPAPPAPHPMPGPHIVHGTHPPAEAAHPETHGRERATALRDTQLALTAARARIRELERQLQAAHAGDADAERMRALARSAEERAREALADLGTARQQIRELKERGQRSTRALLDARRAPKRADKRPGPAERRDRWLAAEDWVRHEILLAWVARVDPSDRERWPLREYAVGPEFAASLDLSDAGRFDTAMRAVVDALTGRDAEIRSREVHRLRAGDGGGDPARTRADGAYAVRSYVEQNTPQARRLHYWVLPGGGVELSRIVAHDDTAT